MKKYKVSVIIKAENNYKCTGILDTIRSIERQTIGFKLNIHLSILLKPNSILMQFCEIYMKLYKDNIKIIIVDDISYGLIGCIRKACGDYIVVVNAGDIFADNTFLDVYNYFEMNKGNIDVVGVRIVSNEKKYFHYGENFQNNLEKNIHLYVDYKKVPSDLNGIFIKMNVAKEKSILQIEDNFDEVVFLIDCLMRRKTFGIAKGNIVLADVEKEVVSIDSFSKDIDLFQKIIIRYMDIMHYTPYFMQWILINKLSDMLENSKRLLAEYNHPVYNYKYEWEQVKEILKNIEDFIILEIDSTRLKKIFIINLKYGTNCSFDVYYNDLKIVYENTALYNISSFVTRIELLEIRNGKLYLEGYIRLPVGINNNSIRIFAWLNEKIYPIKELQRYINACYFDRYYLNDKGFSLVVDLKNIQEIKIGCQISEYYVISKKIEYEPMCPISNAHEGYYYKEGYVITASEDKILCTRCSESDRVQNEADLKSFILKEGGENANELLELRDYYWSNHQNKKKKIWLIMDRPDRADDNGEAFFRYVMSQKNDNIECYFILKKTSRRFDELNKIGPVIDYFSIEHKRLHLLADYVISTQTSEAAFNPFGSMYIFLRDIYRQHKFIFLQHGITHNDNGVALGKYSRNFYGLITSAVREQRYFLEPKFNYSDKEVWLTGFPRFDNLYRNEKKLITIMPTWRKFLTTRIYDKDAGTLIWRVNDNFIESEYFDFYYRLINNKRLLDLTEDLGYKICFLPHPTFLHYADTFRQDNRVEIYDYEKRYQEIYAESNMIVTDYSSVVFDFSYMEKPIIYCQFDKERFYAEHTVKKGYFDHEKDGFGEVTYTLDETIDIIIDYMKNDCNLKEKYRKRIREFFAYNDNNCCKRIYERILEMEK